MNNAEKGHLTEVMVRAELTKLGYNIFLPDYSGCMIDLVLMKDTKLYKVQIKTMRICPTDNNVYKMLTSSSGTVDGSYKKIAYPKEAIDFFIGYNPDDSIFIAFYNDDLVGNEKVFRKEGAPQSRQVKGVNLVSDNLLKDFLDKLGGDSKPVETSYEDRLKETISTKQKQKETNDELKSNETLDKSKKIAVSRIGISGYIGVGVSSEFADGSKLYAATIRPKKGEKQIKIKSSKDPKVCAEAYDKYVMDNNLDKPTNNSLGLL